MNVIQITSPSSKGTRTRELPKVLELIKSRDTKALETKLTDQQMKSVQEVFRRYSY